MIKFGFKIKTRGGMIVENLTVAARDRTEAERKINQIYHRCEILECQELRPTVKEDGLDVEGAIDPIGKESSPEAPRG